ncbi:hypothetical protein B0H19DRAFT_1231078, partial [Mycena capillaripes]
MSQQNLPKLSHQDPASVVEWKVSIPTVIHPGTKWRNKFWKGIRNQEMEIGEASRPESNHGEWSRYGIGNLRTCHKPSQPVKISKKSQGAAPKKDKEKKETAEVKALNATVAAMEAALLVERNTDFLDEEEEAPRPAKRRPLAPPSDDELPFGADDAAGPKRIPSPKQTSPTGSDQEDALNQSQDGDDDDEESAKSQGRIPSPDDSNDMVVDDVLPKTKMGRSRKPRNSNSSAGSSKSSKVRSTKTSLLFFFFFCG